MLAFSGSFTGNSTAGHTITGVPFQPDFVLVKNPANSNDTFFITKDMPTNFSIPVRADGMGDTNHITGITSTGFIVSSDAAVNNNAATIYYLALKDDGSGDFATVTYTGTNVDALAVNVGWQPDYALLKSNSNVVGAEKFSGQGTVSNTYAQTNAVSSMNYQGGSDRNDLIQFTSTGLLLGNGDNSGGNLVNVNSTVHYGIVLKNNGTNILSGSYTGNNTNGRAVTTTFQPIFATVRNNGGYAPEFTFAGQGNNSQPWDGAQSSNLITGLTSSGFTVGTDSTVNGSGLTYWYMAIAAKTSSPFTAALSGSSTVTAAVKKVAPGATAYSNWYTYGSPPNLAATTRQTYLQNAWNQFVTYTFTQTGMVSGMPSGAWRVQVPDQTDRNGNANYTNSEGMGYAMLAAAYMGNPSNPVYDSNAHTYFDGLWKYYNYYKNANGLMSWRVDYQGNVIGGSAGDTGSATDGDVDVAMALIMAHRIWGDAGTFNYGSLASTLLTAIATYEFYPAAATGGKANLMINGDGWDASQTGSPDWIMPDYFAPAFYTEFYNHTGNSRWNDIKAANYPVMVDYFANTYTAGFVPDNATREGGAVTSQSFENGYNAVRRFRQVLDYLWNGGATYPNAYFLPSQLASFMKTASGATPSAAKSEYVIDGSSYNGNYTNATFNQQYAVASLVSNNYYQYAADTYTWLNSNNTNSYFGNGLTLMSMLVASGLMVPNPGATQTIAAAMTGSASVAGAITDKEAIASAMTAAGSMTAAISDKDTIATAISGAGSMTAALSDKENPTAAITGAATVAATLKDTTSVSTAITGAGTATAAITDADSIAATMSGSSSVSASLGGSYVVAAAITGAGTIGRTNLIPNPNFETDTVGNGSNPGNWTSYTSNSGTPTYEGVANDWSAYGTKSFKIAASSAVAQQLVINIPNTIKGQQYVFSAYVKTDSGVTNAALAVYDGGATASNNLGASHDSRASLPWTVVNGGTISFVVGLGVYGSASSGTVWFDGVMLELNGAVGATYFDGSTQGAAWSSTANGSISSLVVPMTDTTTIASSIIGTGTMGDTPASNTSVGSGISGLGSMTAALIDAETIAAAIIGNGTLSATLNQSSNNGITTNITGSGTMAAAIQDADFITVTMAGVSTVYSSLVDKSTIASAITGVGSMAANIGDVDNLNVAMSGAGTMAAVILDKDTIAATIAGVGSMAAAITNKVGVAVPMYGAGTSVVAITDVISIAASMLGASTVTITDNNSDTVRSAITGASSVSAALAVVQSISATINGTGTMNNPIIGSLNFIAFMITGSGQMTAAIADQPYNPNYGKMSLSADDGNITYLREGSEISVTLRQQ